MSEKRSVALAYFYTADEKEEVESFLQECSALCHACGMKVVVEVCQQVPTSRKKIGFGKGKLEEIQHTLVEMELDCIVFGNNLSVGVYEQMVRVLQVEVLDRTALILHIFSLRARSKEAKLQVEAARLQYDLPRIHEYDDTESHARGGGFANRGAGEMRSHIMKRKYQSRIQQLQQELRAIEKENASAEWRRQKTNLARVALVGYTNAGKSSLMNAILQTNGNQKREVYVKDMLFATLDTSVRKVMHHSRAFLLYDTVGFVSNLPHELIEAFKSTLSAAREADLLLHIIDASDPFYREKMDITEQTLNDIQASDIPVLRIFNKIDLVNEEAYFDGYTVSAITKEGLEEVLDAIINTVYPITEIIRCKLPYRAMKLIAQYKKVLDITILAEEEDGLLIQVGGTKESLLPFRKYQI